MANIKAGDTVRYLNATGGGIVRRIEGQIAYIDEDGFETPVLASECVVVAVAGEKPTTRTFREVMRPSEPEPKPKAAPKAPQPAPEPEPEPVEEVEGNDKLDLVLAWAPRDPRNMSLTDFDTYLVNDSNYYLSYIYMSRADGEKCWTLRATGLVEPNMQILVEELPRAEAGRLDRVALQWVAYKLDRPFEAKAPGWVERSVDTVKFFKLHCFKPSVYFDEPVMELPLALADVIQQSAPAAPDLTPLRPKEADVKRRVTRRPMPGPKRQEHRESNVHVEDGVIVVDLHSAELFDTTRGLSNADILNRQIDEFERVMKANLKRRGQKIVFIHGKGEGVLRQALMKELNHRYKGVADVQDASFRQYGFGATQVTIR